MNKSSDNDLTPDEHMMSRLAKNYEYLGAMTLSIRFQEMLMSYRTHSLSTDAVMNILDHLVKVMHKEYHRKLSSIRLPEVITEDNLATLFIPKES